MTQPVIRLRPSQTLSFAFLLTGAATALLGATLPVLLKEGHLSDTTGGSLLLLAWGGSTCGALLCRGNLRRAAAGGLMMTALSMLALAEFHRSAALPLFALYGLGLGVSMTAITLLAPQGQTELVQRATLMRLNLLWSVGACLAPTLAAHALAADALPDTRAGGLFRSVGLVFCASAAMVFLSRSALESTAATKTLRITLPTPPIPLYAIAFLAVGVESAIGGWLTTYAGRTQHTELIALSATSAFWVGLLLSRALHSICGLRWLQGTAALTTHAVIAALATLFLLVAPHTAAFVPSALLAGFGLGPLYPRVLAMVVGSYKPRAVFIVAGVGSATLPWLTGTLSHAAGSLGAGLLVPCVGAASLLILMLCIASEPSSVAG
jgi:fucose permease